MREENPRTRDYLSGSRLAPACSRLARWFFWRAESLLGRLAWREISPQTFSACLGAYVVSNTLGLFLLQWELSAWALLLRGAGCATALLGFFGPKDWRSVRESSFFLRLAGKFHARG